MNIKQRNQLIKKLSKTVTVAELSKRFKISSEWIYHLQGRRKVEVVNYGVNQKKYQDNIHKIIKNNLQSEVVRFSKSNRNKEVILQKTIFIKTLIDKYGYNLNKVAKLLNNDHTTIRNLYIKK